MEGLQAGVRKFRTSGQIGFRCCEFGARSLRLSFQQLNLHIEHIQLAGERCLHGHAHLTVAPRVNLKIINLHAINSQVEHREASRLLLIRGNFVVLLLIPTSRIAKSAS